ncbi:hypothetical protein CAPTEDRAFT_186029 [Capitella teleta]|uniref:Ig-like domain-containing protein n=1 Tax=Capitella teleta TaxID=283909 RepID=R7VCE3_CAPTE|nr:hypothetical protein CAPTEDRAFT_186029 [Capitella teleta]|eukprot:ELU13355.1 hypothetical protein CAPTEDRAFT_186029 [Capitella teleta]
MERSDIVFQNTPGLVKVNEQSDAQLMWKTTRPVTSHNITHDFHHTETVYDDLLLKVANGLTFTFFECKDRCQSISGTHYTGITIRNITAADAKSKYIVTLDFGIQAQNDDAGIYVFLKPNMAQLNASDSDGVEVGDDLRLTCISSSNSLPEANRTDVMWSYKWIINGKYYQVPWELPDRHTWEEEDRQVLLISDIVREDSGSVYSCTGSEDGSGRDSDPSDPYVLDVPYAPSLLTVFPGNRIHGVEEGDSVYFMVEAFSNPAPDFQWKRIFNNGTNINIPSEDSGNKSNLTISDITIEDFGTYAVSAQNEKGRWEDVILEIRLRDKPQIPTNLSYEATGKSLLMSWTPGWNGGVSQTFTIYYSTDGFSTKTDIPDSLNSKPISYKLIEGISTKKTYSVDLIAFSSQGTSELVTWEAITTPGLPSFTVTSIIIDPPKSRYANITFALDVDLVDRVVIKAMSAVNNDVFIETTVTTFDQYPIDIPVPTVDNVVFDFSVYKIGDLLDYEARLKPFAARSTDVGLVVGVVVGFVAISALFMGAIFFNMRHRNPKSPMTKVITIVITWLAHYLYL